MHLSDVIVGAIVAGAIALIAWRVHALTRGGAIAAFFVGTLTYGTGTLPFTLVLLAFFVPSVVLSRVGKARKRGLVDVGKSGPRDAWQVAANGGVSTMCAVVWALTRDPHWAVAFAGAYAAATADTWGTEIGTLVKQAPRSILTFRRLPTGLSGGVTAVGTLAEIVGALWIGTVALRAFGPITWPLTWYPVDPATGFPPIRLDPVDNALFLRLVLAIPLGGFLGALADSVLGATAQELRHCDACGRDCETDPHACGAPTRLVRGMRGASNDVVNLLATLVGALVAFTLA
ncbi:MAG: DUF92 domain-containing protein [Candidatus Eremiobacteraeota bacterium]|nr:DUF92 domain-containing protein [Candidatus Eremiobacteraeota bacterium]MBV9408873.1 DUF92 domain-containing protein [Candidatus Eremiobacteraeota bacterium]